ncbi:MAG TPA: hypothetical protein VMM18_02330 [Gemmatimonadaceae bacterium]|nr:hypothetical protein [Gemmatimonadaceae bacterium]
MNSRIATLTALAAFLLAAPLGAQTADESRTRSLELARRYTTWFYTGEADSLWANMSPRMKRRLGTARELIDIHRRLITEGGAEIAVLEERFVTRYKRAQYWRTARFSEVSEPVLLRWVIAPDGRIDAMGLGPLSRAPSVDRSN